MNISFMQLIDYSSPTPPTHMQTPNLFNLVAIYALATIVLSKLTQHVVTDYLYNHQFLHLCQAQLIGWKIPDQLTTIAYMLSS